MIFPYVTTRAGNNKKGVSQQVIRARAKVKT